MERTVRPVPELELRVPDDTTLLQLVRITMQVGVKAAEPGAVLEALAGLLVSPVDPAAVARRRAREHAKLADLSDAAVWMIELMDRHGSELTTRCLHALLGVPHPAAVQKVARGKRR